MRCSLNLLKNLIFRHVLALNDISTVIIDVYNYLREDRKLKARKSNRMAPAAMKTYMKNTSVSNPSSNSTICNSNVLNVSLSLLGNICYISRNPGYISGFSISLPVLFH